MIQSPRCLYVADSTARGYRYRLHSRSACPAEPVPRVPVAQSSDLRARLLLAWRTTLVDCSSGRPLGPSGGARRSRATDHATSPVREQIARPSRAGDNSGSGNAPLKGKPEAAARRIGCIGRGRGPARGSDPDQRDFGTLMLVQDLGDWRGRTDGSRRGCGTIKRLSAATTRTATGGHGAGPYIGKQVIFMTLIPSLHSPRAAQPSCGVRISRSTAMRTYEPSGPSGTTSSPGTRRE